jgi:coenzyme A diphosphatase NUDT7
MIETLYNMGRLREKVPGGPDLTDAEIKTAKVAAEKARGAKI